MEIKKQYLQKYLHDIAIEQIADEYQKKGYAVSKEEKLGNEYQADLIVRKGNETIVIEVKSEKMSEQRKKEIANLANYVRKQENFKFFVAVATAPKEKKLQITQIEDLLTENMIEDFPEELDRLSTHTRIEDVTDVDIDIISIDGKEIFVSGDGVVNVELQFGSDGDQSAGDGFKTHDSFPFDFEIVLEYDTELNLKITDIREIEIDTSSYYGNGE